MSIACVILAGGQSKRMGKDKTSLSLKGKRLIDHMASLTKDLHDALYISGQDSFYLSLPDPIPFQGPLFGIYHCIQQLCHKYTGALFVPVDMPLLTKEILSVLTLKDDLYDISYYDNHPLPLFVKFTPSILNDVKINDPSLIAGNSIFSFIKRYNAKKIPLTYSLEEIFKNINTPEDWQNLLENTA